MGSMNWYLVLSLESQTEQTDLGILLLTTHLTGNYLEINTMYLVLVSHVLCDDVDGDHYHL